MFSSSLLLVMHALMGGQAVPSDSATDRQFESLAARYLDQFPALSPVAATPLGDHRFDAQLDQISPRARAEAAEFYRQTLEQIVDLDATKLSRPNQVDRTLLEHHLRGQLWRGEQLREWEWNPLVYTELAGTAVYGLMAREFAPLRQRMVHAGQRLEQFPRLFQQIRSTLVPEQVPRIHAQTAVKQNRGVLSIIDNMVEPQLDQLPPGQRDRLRRAMEIARGAVESHQKWLEAELLPKAAGSFRLGAKRYDKKLAFTLQASLNRQQIQDRAERKLRGVRQRMYTIAKDEYRRKHPFTRFPADPSDAYKQAIIRSVLEMAYRDAPRADQIVDTVKQSLELTTAFVLENDLVTVPPDPVEIIVMPEFQRGVSAAYCDAPGPLDVGQKTFYAVAPLPKDWTTEQNQSFLREYNLRSIHNLTIHEAMPGHFVQLAHANRYPGKLRAVMSSGVFIEGWAVYTEQMMSQQGFLDHDPLMQLIALKWYLRGIANAIMDQAIHAEAMTREEAMELMIEDTFQEEREAAAKWVRAQLTSAQLSTYFVGYLEHADLRREVEEAWGDDFNLKTYHDKVISFGSPPVKFVRALMLDKEIPR